MRRTAALFALLPAMILLFSPLTSHGTECNARSAVVMEWCSETVLYEKNADLPLPQASTTKIMTALLVLESADPGEIFRVSAKAAAVEGSQLGLKEGDELSVSDLLYILMLKSGNDAAEALAEGVAGSVAAFVEKMNRKAEALGLENTRFQNPHGLPAEGHYTTARDLARLTAEALENETFRQIVSAERTTLTYKNAVISNSNKLLGVCDGVFGVKTGFTKKAGRCLVTAAEREGVTLICVTLNDGDDWRDHAALYDACFARTERRQAVAAKGYGLPLPVLGGEKTAFLRNSLPLTCVAVDGAPVPFETVPKTVPMVFAPVEQGRTMGYLQAVCPTGRVMDSVPLNVETGVGIKKEERTFLGSFPLKLRKLWREFISGTVF